MVQSTQPPELDLVIALLVEHLVLNSRALEAALLLNVVESLLVLLEANRVEVQLLKLSARAANGLDFEGGVEVNGVDLLAVGRVLAVEG
eukprot:CAMPEP_0168621602 /NCGR_PEP_ID=MMETSP0449_2-20121227/7788_1 /TAXON_ID=1082188 /ORGANISM="Strombidium rassoulzadegani, Strain ras09" /LENGTH=88 /DNA_ID=CAMNT_0008662745 /DNA_START=460 /DNA_END=722 /DNA_ORIENTATION=-